jgi:hypothetical protein
VGERGRAGCSWPTWPSRDLGVAAAEAPDGTITVAYGIPTAAPGGAVALRRIAPDGVAGPIHTVPGVGASLNQTLAADAQGTTYALLPGAAGGVAIRWPADGTPEVFASSGLKRRQIESGVPAVTVADGKGGAWMRLQDGDALALAHVGRAGASVTPVASAATASAGPAVAADGSALIARSGKGLTTVLERLAPDGRRAPARRLAADGRIAALAIDPGTGGSVALLRGRRASLELARAGRRPVVLRRRKGYGQFEASLAIGADGRAWAAWEEVSDRLESTCNRFPLREGVRWATLARGARQVTSRPLRGAPVTRTFQ